MSELVQPNVRLMKPTLTLFSNQLENVSKLVRRRRALLTDRVGAGKTITILYAFAYLKERGKLSNLLVLTPKSGYEKTVWPLDIKKWTNLKCIDLETLQERVGGSYSTLTKLMSQYDVIYGKHTHVKKCAALIKEILASNDVMLTLDEVHAFKNRESELTSLMRGVTLKCNNIWGITGTSLSKNLADFYNVVNLIKPWFFGSFIEFQDKYCKTTEQVIGRRAGRIVKVRQIVGIKNQDEFKEAIEPLVITGEAFANLKFHWVSYNLSPFEANLYKKIANGIDVESEKSNEDWIHYVLNDSNPIEEHPIKEVERHSSRFIYLQSAADGVLSDRGTQDREDGTKMRKLVNLVKEIVDKKQTVIVYFDFYAPLEVAERLIKREVPKAKVLISTGENTLDANALTEEKCARNSYVVLCTRAASESASYYFINNTVFFNIPTVPATFVQLNGRITRRNTLYPDDLNCYIFTSENIDQYKMMVVSSKAAQMEVIQGHENLVPDDYKQIMSKVDNLKRQKKLLLWQRY